MRSASRRDLYLTTHNTRIPSMRALQTARMQESTTDSLLNRSSFTQIMVLYYIALVVLQNGY
jgi:hypothetical protein